MERPPHYIGCDQFEPTHWTGEPVPLRCKSCGRQALYLCLECWGMAEALMRPRQPKDALIEWRQREWRGA